jgi:hypothetical protein
MRASARTAPARLAAQITDLRAAFNGTQREDDPLFRASFARHGGGILKSTHPGILTQGHSGFTGQDQAQKRSDSG